MSEQRPARHQRSKSALARSLLHRDKLKVEGGEDDKSATGSDIDSETGASQYRGFGSLRSSRQKHQATTSATLEPPTRALTSASSTNTGRKSIESPLGVGETIEQSVRKFKLFEVLRSGNEAAVAQAVRETSGTAPASDKDTKSFGSLEGTTLLHLAIQCADPSVVEQILSVAKASPDLSINVNAADREGNTPLHLASSLGRPTTVRLLLEQKNVNDALVNYQGRSPLDLARTPETFQQLQLFRSIYIDSKVKEIHDFVGKHSYGELERLFEDPHVERVLDVNSEELATDPGTAQSGGTLLHEATRNKDFQLIQLLLMHGADPFRRDRKGKLPQDITKDDKTRNILKRSPAAAVAQRSVQEKAILGNSLSPGGDSTPGGKEAREMKGYLKKWTNYTSGYKLRWLVLEDGVLSYYKQQDDAGSACRGAINMKITTLYMDPQDKTKFEIQGKSSVKYHLKANHAVEAKRWFWTLTNAIQWTKDEAKEEQRQKQSRAEHIRKTKLGEGTSPVDGKSHDRGLATASVSGVPLTATSSRISLKDTTPGPPSVFGDDEGSVISYRESLALDEGTQAFRATNTKTNLESPQDDDDDGDDASNVEVQPVSKDAFNITAHSANLQLSLLGQVSAALQVECSKGSTTPISDPTVTQAITTYQSAVQSLRDLIGDMLRISRDRDAYWQHRLDLEVDARRMWEQSMVRISKEQEALEGRIGHSEDKRKRTKRALRDALEGTSLPPSRPENEQASEDQKITEEIGTTLENLKTEPTPARRKSIGIRERGRRKSTIASLTNLSDSDSEEDEEFFDAVDAGEVEITELPPVLTSPLAISKANDEEPAEDLRETRKAEILPSFKGYEDPIRQHLQLDPKNRPPRSLWNILKNMVGKDMSKMALPVTLNEPTSLLQRVTEDMEYSELLDTAADRTDPTERMLYVAAFAASEYASTLDRVAKPFNPLLGETYEYVRPDKGYRFLVEQVSHHPPVGAAWAESAQWEYYGRSAVESSFWGSSFDVTPQGTWFLRLRPTGGGTELYTWNKVTSSVTNLIFNPTVDNHGKMTIKNHTSGELCVLDFKKKSRGQSFNVSGNVLSEDGKICWSIGGKWNSQILARLTPGRQEELTLSSTKAGSDQAFLLWQAHERPKNIPFNLTPFAVSFQSLPDRLRPLLPPTDTRFRPDQRAMEDGEWDLAATEKTRVEEGQRTRKRERDAMGEVWEPRWFEKATCEVTGEEYWKFNGVYWRMREGVTRGGNWEGVNNIF